MGNIRQPRIGDVFIVNFDCSGSVQTGTRPAVVIQNNKGNVHSPNIIVLPLTSKIKKTSQPTHVMISKHDTSLKLDSVVLCENPECISKNSLGCYLTTLDKKYMKRIAVAYSLASSLLMYIDRESLSDVWEKAVELNRIEVA